MKRMLSTMMCSLTFLMLICSLAVPALVAVVTPAEAPVWEEGKKWAYGSESDMGAEFADQLNDLSDTLEGWTGGTVNELSMDGSVGMWTLFEVTEANSEVYVVSMTMAGKVSLEAAVSVTAQMEKAGTYNWTDDIETEEMDVDAEASVDLAVIMEVDVTFEHDTMAIKSIAMNVEVTGAVDFTANNIPMSEDDWSNWTKDIWYEDFDVSGELNLNLALDLEFVPALNIWDFPLAVGDTWSVDSEATLSGSLSGMLNIDGLPEDMMEEMFSEEFIEETGFTDFPIIFEELNGGDDFPFDDGVMEESTEDIHMDLECIDAFVWEDDYWSEITVYEIAVEDSPLVFYYSPDVGFLSYFSMNSDDLGDIVEMPISFGQEMSMDAVNPDVAEEKINEIAEFQGGLGGDEGGMTGFFMDPPYLGLILLGAIIVVVVAAVMFMRKK